MAAAVLESISAPHTISASLSIAAVQFHEDLHALSENCIWFEIADDEGPSSWEGCLRGTEATIDVPDVSKATWQSQVIEATSPVLVEFWAPWCGPCRMIYPVIGKLSKTYEGKLDCLKLNTDENPDISTQYGIRSIPTIMIFKNGEKKEAIIGAVPESTLATCVEKFLER